MSPTTHTETHPLVFGQEVSFGSIVGPVDFIDVYVDGNPAPNATVEWRLYATVGSLVSQVAKSLGGGKSASVLKWQGGSGAYSPVAADGSTYELRAYWAQQGPAPTMKASIVGYDEFDTVSASGSSFVQTIPAGFGEVTFASASGYSQFADAAVEQDFIGKVLFTLYALSEGGGVEAAIATQELSQEDGINRIFANLKLPGAVSYRLAASDPTGQGGQVVTASLAAYSTVPAAPAPTNTATFGDSPGSELFSAIENPPLETTDATPIDSLVAFYDMPDNTVADVLVTVVAKQHASANCWRQDFRGVYARNGGPPAIVAPLVSGTAVGSLLVAATLVIIGNTIRAEVTGIAATNISWSVTMDVQPVTP